MQPNKPGQRATLSVDIQKVIEAEAGIYTRQIADLVRQIAVLSTALDDSEAMNRELQAKVQALGGGGPMPSAAAFNPALFTRPASASDAPADLEPVPAG